MSWSTIELERSANGVVQLRLNRPEKRNAQTVEMWRELHAVGVELVGDRSVRAVVLSGKGETFSAGIDLSVLMGAAQSSGGSVPIEVELVQAAFRWLRQAPFPTLAAVHGYALGAGAQLALACDLRIFSDTAVMGFPEVNYAILPDLGGCVWLPEIVGQAKAKELLLLGERFDAGEAHRLGIANRVVPAAELAGSVDAIAAALAAKAPLALQAAKRAIAAAAESEEAGFKASAAGIRRCFGSADFVEMGRAAAEKRAPAFTGR